MSAADRARIVQRFRFAASASIAIGANLNEAADRFYEAISRAPAEDYPVFDDVIAEVEDREGESYHPMMLAAEALAACLLRSDDYAPIVRGWAHRDSPVARTAAVAVYSKASDFDRGKIDFDTLAELVASLDDAPDEDDEVTRMYLSRLACKLRDTSEGADLIETMASRGAPLRIAAVHAIASDLSMEPPERHLAVLRDRESTPPSKEEPPRRLFWLFLSLLHDADPSVSQQAQYALELIRRSWPGLWNRLVNFRASPVSEGPNPLRDAGGPAAQFANDAAAAVETALAELRARTNKQWTPDELAQVRQADLDRSKSAAGNPRGVKFALRAPADSNKQHGVLTWDPEMLAQDQQAEAAGEAPIRIDGAPRLFLSYRWSQAVDQSGAIDFFAGSLFNRGYDLVFDRDPRHLEKQLSAYDVLLLLYGCTHFVPLLTDELVDFLAEERAAKTPIDLEMELARTLEAEGQLQWLPVHMNSPSPPEEIFPTRQFQVIATFADGHRGGSQPIERRHVRAVLAQVRAMPDVVDVAVHDVTGNV